jgi:spore coat polysaccharide biosynthesis protein SpsF
MIRFLIRRLRPTNLASDLILATTGLPEDDALAAAAAAEGVRVFRGPKDDVVARLDQAARELEAEFVVRVTGDCPFVDSETLDYCLAVCRSFEEFDLATTKSAFPVGIDFEIYRVHVLRRLHEANVLSSADREHVTKYFYDHPAEFNLQRIEPRPEWIARKNKFTIDDENDYRFAQRLVDSLGGYEFSVADLLGVAEAVS